MVEQQRRLAGGLDSLSRLVLGVMRRPRPEDGLGRSRLHRGGLEEHQVTARPGYCAGRFPTPGHVPGVDDDRTPLTDAWRGPARLYRPDRDGLLFPVGNVIEAICGCAVEPPGHRSMTYVVLDATAGAQGRDRLVALGQPVKLEYRVPIGSTRQARIDYEMDVLGWLGCALAAVEVWLRDHELWMGRRVTLPRLGSAV